MAAPRSRWRKALIVSALIHCVVLTILGMVAAQAFMPPTKETFLEVELYLPGSAPAAAAAPASPLVTRGDDAALAPVREPEAPVMTAAPGAISMIQDEPVGQALSGSDRPPSAPGVTPASTAKPAVITPPAVLSAPQPAYPEQARKDGSEGTVILAIEILENGRPGSVAVQRSSGHEELDEAAVKAVKNWRFTAARNSQTGQAVSCRTKLPVTFTLRS